MRAAAWNNGHFTSTGTGYGLSINAGERDRWFRRTWPSVILDLPNGRTGIRVRLSNYFWRNCPELRSAEVGRWLIGIDHQRWPRGKPPAFTLIQVRGNHFAVS